MFTLIIQLFKDLVLYVGYIKKGVFNTPLSNEEEEKYIKNLFVNDDNIKQEARNKLIEHNLRLVAHIAKKYDNCNEDFEDLISIGTIGLIKAVDTYKNDNGNKLATYAAKCIENEILMHLRSLKKSSNDLYLNDSIGEDSDGSDITLMDIIPIENENIGENIDKNNNLKYLKSFLNVLNDTELKIINLRYGLNNCEEKTQKEIGKMFNISRSYVSRIEKRALTKLLFEFRKKNLV